MADDVDDRWVRDGRTLGEWLSLLVHPSTRQRRLAENAVSAMWWGVAVADAQALTDAPADGAGHRRAFTAAVSRAILAAGDEGRVLLERIAATIRTDRIQHWQKFQLEDRLMDITLDPELAEPGEAESLEAEIKSMAAFDAGRMPNSHGPHTLHIVLESAGEALLAHDDLARAWLDDADVAGDVLDAIASLGRRGATFAPDLLARLAPAARDRKEANVERIRIALAAVGGHDAATVRRLVDDARPTDAADRAAWAALESLASIGPAALAFAPTLVDDLLPPADADEGPAAYRLKLLAAIDPTRRDVFERLLADARPSPPRVRKHQVGETSYDVDEVPHRRGTAIDGLGHFVRFADEAVPVLVEALSSFEEYDPDWCYELGEHGRVVDALQRLGPASAMAVPALVERLRMKDGDVDWRIVRFLGHLGPAARDALPTLRAMQATFGVEPFAPSREPDELTEPLAWALMRIDDSGRHG